MLAHGESYVLTYINTADPTEALNFGRIQKNHEIFVATLSDHLFFFFKFFGRHMSFLVATGTPVLDFCDVSSGFQSQSGFCLIRYFCGGKCNVHSPRFTSGATLADLLAAGAQLVTSPHACAEVGLGSDSNVQPHEQKTNALPLCQRPGFSVTIFTLFTGPEKARPSGMLLHRSAKHTYAHAHAYIHGHISAHRSSSTCMHIKFRTCTQ